MSIAASGRTCASLPSPALAARLVRSLLLVALAAGLSPAEPAAGQEPRPLRVGAVLYKSEGDFRATYEPLVDYLAAELGREGELSLLEGDRLAYQLAAGELDLGIFTPFPFLKAKLDFPELEVFASHVVRGGETYRGAILVRAESAIQSLDDLRGRSMRFVKPTSTSGFKLPEGILRENGLALEESLASYDFSGSHEASVSALLAGEVDAVAVDLEALNALTPGDRVVLRVVEEYDVPYHAYVASPRLAGEVRAGLRQAMLGAHRNPDNRALFDNPLAIERWTSRDDTFYNPLRRYLGMVRTKPQFALTLDLKPSARRALERQGDLLEVLEDGLRNELLRTHRFALKGAGATEALLAIDLDLALIEEAFHCQIYLNGEWLRSVDLPASALLEALPGELAQAVLAATPVETPLFFNGAEWFISYGENDGIDTESYDFALRTGSGELVVLPPEAVVRTTPLNTVFEADPDFRRGLPVLITHRLPAGEGTQAGSPSGGDAVSHDHPEESGLEGFWNNLDNRWGVIGLLAAALSLALGGYLKVRRQRRFRAVLNESLDLLRLYLEGKYDLQNRLLEQREKILHYLERNFISENQYLILKTHLDEVEGVIGKLATQDAGDSQEVQAELLQIVADGKVSEGELEHLASLLEVSKEAAESN